MLVKGVPVGYNISVVYRSWIEVYVYNVTGCMAHVGESTGDWWFPHKVQVGWSFNVFFTVIQNKLLNKQSSFWWATYCAAVQPLASPCIWAREGASRRFRAFTRSMKSPGTSGRTSFAVAAQISCRIARAASMLVLLCSCGAECWNMMLSRRWMAPATNTWWRHQMEVFPRCLIHLVHWWFPNVSEIYAYIVVSLIQRISKRRLQ